MNGVERIAAERQRQIENEGWSVDRDQQYTEGELIRAAVSYALANRYGTGAAVAHWPWSERWWKPGDPIRNLEKAGALIAAEIDRLQALASSGK